MGKWSLWSGRSAIYPLPARLQVCILFSWLLGDLKLKDAMCVLECLYNEDVREIQDKINYIIEQVQIATADPKAKGSLGVVGVFPVWDKQFHCSLLQRFTLFLWGQYIVINWFHMFDARSLSFSLDSVFRLRSMQECTEYAGDEEESARYACTIDSGL